VNRKEKQLAAKLLDFLSDILGDRSANDTPKEWLEGWTEQELAELDRKMHDYNRSPEEAGQPPWSYKSDFFIAGYLADRLRKEACLSELTCPRCHSPDIEQPTESSDLYHCQCCEHFFTKEDGD
jgi:hypothetical protein